MWSPSITPTPAPNVTESLLSLPVSRSVAVTISNSVVLMK